MKVLLATSWDTVCGIAMHSAMLKEAVEAADPEIVVLPSVEALDPAWLVRYHNDLLDVIVLNYHLALHSRWTPDRVRDLREAGYPVVIIAHDTVGENPPSALFTELCALANAFIVHEPCQGLEQALYWRMGVPEVRGDGFVPVHGDERPILGTLGFDFGWKSFDQIAEVTAEIGWGFTIVCPEMSEAREDALLAKNPWLEVHRGADMGAAVNYLRGCDATAFMYQCSNSGQSGAILQGIAARKPVYALRGCRQFRALYTTEGGTWQALRWVDEFRDLRERLLGDPLTRLDPMVVRLAEQDSWPTLGKKYADLFKSLVQ